MNYQLVIQILSESLDDFDTLIELEEAIAEAIGESADVDGHDLGSGEANIFIHTANPVDTFSQVRQVIEINGLSDQSKAAYRELSGEEYTNLWPEGYSGIFTLQ